MHISSARVALLLVVFLLVASARAGEIDAKGTGLKFNLPNGWKLLDGATGLYESSDPLVFLTVVAVEGKPAEVIKKLPEWDPIEDAHELVVHESKDRKLNGLSGAEGHGTAKYDAQDLVWRVLVVEYKPGECLMLLVSGDVKDVRKHAKVIDALFASVKRRA